MMFRPRLVQTRHGLIQPGAGVIDLKFVARRAGRGARPTGGMRGFVPAPWLWLGASDRRGERNVPRQQGIRRGATGKLGRGGVGGQLIDLGETSLLQASAA